MWLRLTFFIALVVSLAACSSVSNRVSSFMGGEDNIRPPTPLQPIGEQVIIQSLWKKSVGDGADEKYLKLLPAHDDGRIFAAESNGEVIAIDADSGKSLWTSDIDIRITGGPGAGDGLVLVGTGEADVIALAAETGDLLWQSKVSSEVLAAPLIGSNIVVARTIDGKLFGLNADDGTRLWVYDRAVPSLTLRGTSKPVIARGLVIAGFDEGRLVAIELQTGKLVWETRIAIGTGRSDIERMVDIDAEPVIYDDTIYVATFQGRVAALSADGGRIIWTRDIPSYAGINVDNDHVYVADDEGAVWALNRDNGNSAWKIESLLARAVTAPAMVGDTVVVGDVEGYLHWLDRDTGEMLGRNRMTGSPLIAPPVALNEVIYAYASDGTLAAYTYQENPDYVAPVAQETAADEATGEEAAGTETTGEDGTEVAEEEEESFLKKLLDGFGDDDEEAAVGDTDY